jgi:hypothetical protein
MHAFLGQPMPIPDARIVRLRVRQAEPGLVQKQKRGLLGLETTGFEGLSAVIRAFAVTARLGRKNATLPAAAGQIDLPTQHSLRCALRSMSSERRLNFSHLTMKPSRSSRAWRRR